jgi:hypothetical protein
MGKKTFYSAAFSRGSLGFSVDIRIFFSLVSLHPLLVTQEMVKREDDGDTVPCLF